MSGLREALADWTDWDGAEEELARVLGLLVKDGRTPKWVFWSNYPVGEMLAAMLRQLTEVGVLEYREEPDQQYRWNPTFRGDWD